MTLPDPPPPQPEDPGPDDEAPAPGAGFDYSDPNSPLASLYLQTGHLVAVALLGLLFVFFSLMIPLESTDSWGHLAFGRWMAENGKLPEREPLSPFSDRDTPYVNFQWLPQRVGYWLYHAGEWLAGGNVIRETEGGVQMLRTAHAVIGVLRFLVLLIAFRRLCGSLPLACAGIVLVFLFSMLPASVQRPQAVGELLFACLLVPLARPLLSVRSLVVLPLLFALWANCHGSFLVGLMLLGLFLAGRGLEVMRAANTWNPLPALRDPQVRRLLLALALAAAAAALLNPYGPSLVLDVLRLSRHPNLATIEEWTPLDFSLDGGGGHWGYLALLVLVGLSQALSPRGLSPTQVLLLVTFGVLPLFQQRFMVWWVMLVPWLVLPLWAAIGERLAWPWLHFRSVPDLRKTAIAVMLVLVALVWSGPAHWITTGSPQPLTQSLARGTPWRVALQLQLPPGSRPALPKLAEGLAAHYPQGFAGRIFASEGVADYLLYALPGSELLAYSHAHLFPREHWLDYVTVLHGWPGWQDVLDRHRVNLVVIEAGPRRDLAERLRRAPQWEVVLDEAAAAPGSAGRGPLLVALRKRAQSADSAKGR